MGKAEPGGLTPPHPPRVGAQAGRNTARGWFPNRTLILLPRRLWVPQGGLRQSILAAGPGCSCSMGGSGSAKPPA